MNHLHLDLIYTKLVCTLGHISLSSGEFLCQGRLCSLILNRFLFFYVVMVTMNISNVRKISHKLISPMTYKTDMLHVYISHHRWEIHIFSTSLISKVRFLCATRLVNVLSKIAHWDSTLDDSGLDDWERTETNNICHTFDYFLTKQYFYESRVFLWCHYLK